MLWAKITNNKRKILNRTPIILETRIVGQFATDETEEISKLRQQ